MVFDKLNELYDVKHNKNGITVLLSQKVTITTTKNTQEKKYGMSTISMRHNTISKEDEYIKSVNDDEVEDICLRFCGKVDTGLKYGATPNELLEDFKKEYPKLEREDRTLEILKSRLDNWLKEGQDILKELEML